MRCPVCKAENTTGPQCRRCKADLGLLWTLEDQRRRELAEARRCLVAGRWPEAVRHAARAYRLLNDEEAHRLLAAAHLLARDFAAAWGYYRAGTSPPARDNGP
jgi:hypothetical protein